MRRYQFLDQDGIYEALNRLRNALLAAKDGDEVDHIINGLFTHDERMKIGRRIQVAEFLALGMRTDEIESLLNVGRTTITLVNNAINNHPECFELISSRQKKIDEEFRRKAYKKTGGSKLFHKRTEYTGFRRKDVKR